jgi:type VI secretion system protein ImpK
MSRTPTRRRLAGESQRAAPGELARPGVRLLWEAQALLALVPQLRATGFVADLARLREKLAAMLRDFQARVGISGIEAPRVAQATAVLAALIDHVVTSMPWGADAGWQSLAASPVSAHPVARAAQAASPAAAARLLEVTRASASDAGLRELIGVALALGFDGRSRGAEEAQIDQVRAALAAADPHLGMRAQQELSAQWQSSVERGSALTSWLPLWVSSLIVAAALATLFFALERSLALRSDRLYARLAALNAPAAVAPRPLPAPQPRLAALLSAEAAAHELSVRDEIDRSVIVVPGVQLFEAGDATLRPASTDLLRPIAATLQRAPGRIQVIGHTERALPRSARYPSDWDLSVDRARSVQEALHALGVESSRLAYDGRASIEPAGDDIRSQAVGGDGRIEIVLLAGR